MKTQLKKGVIEIFVLAQLTKGESYGYEIVFELAKHIDITESTLYPILRRLEQSGELRTRNQIYNGRNRKYYAINNKGYDHIDMFLDEWKDIKQVYNNIISGNYRREMP